MERSVGTEPLDSGDRGPILHDSQCEAGIDPPTVDQDGAGAALAMVAAFLRAGQIEMVAQRVQKRRPGCDRQPTLDAIHMKRDGHLGWGRICWRWVARRGMGSSHRHPPSELKSRHQIGSKTI